MAERCQSKVPLYPPLWHANGIGSLCHVRFIQRLLQEDVDGDVRAGHEHQHRDLGLLLQ